MVPDIPSRRIRKKTCGNRTGEANVMALKREETAAPMWIAAFMCLQEQ